MMARVFPWLYVTVGLVTACAPEAKVRPPSASPGGDTGGYGDSALTTAVFSTVSEDYAVGALATVDLDDWQVTDSIVDTAGDSVVVASGGLVFQLNRYGFDTVRIYEPGAWDAPITEVALSDLANPHDVRVCGGAAFVTQYGRAEVSVLDPLSGLFMGAVDLSAYDDGDGTPEASRIVQAENGRLYIGLHNLDRTTDWGSVGGGVVEVDCDRRAVTASWDFADADVYPFPSDPSKVVVSSDGEGVFLLDTDSGTAERVVSADVLGGTVDGLAAADGRAVVVTSDGSGDYAIGCLDLSDGSWTLAERSDNYLIHVAGTDRGEAWISARTHWSNPSAANGAIIYDIATCSRRTEAGPIATVMAPTSIAFY